MLRAMRIVMQGIFTIRRALFGILRIRTRGVKIMLFNAAGELLLIRNSYGASHLHVLPGGGIKRGEAPVDAAARELDEEVGMKLIRPVLIGTHQSRFEGKRDTVYIFSGLGEGLPRPDGVEVEEARFFALDALPDTVSAATLRRIAEYQGRQERAAAW